MLIVFGGNGDEKMEQSDIAAPTLKPLGTDTARKSGTAEVDMSTLSKREQQKLKYGGVAPIIETPGPVGQVCMPLPFSILHYVYCRLARILTSLSVSLSLPPSPPPSLSSLYSHTLCLPFSILRTTRHYTSHTLTHPLARISWSIYPKVMMSQR